ncbi:hypothetical protein PO909_010297 [Leuciscus waleckii]
MNESLAGLERNESQMNKPQKPQMKGSGVPGIEMENKRASGPCCTLRSQVGPQGGEGAHGKQPARHIGYFLEGTEKSQGFHRNRPLHWRDSLVTLSSSSIKVSLGHGGGFQTSPNASAALLSIAAISGSGLGSAGLPEGGSGAKSSSPEPSSPSDAAMDILSSGWGPERNSWSVHYRGTSSFLGELQRLQCEGGVRDPQGFAGQITSHCNPQITQPMRHSNLL